MPFFDLPVEIRLKIFAELLLLPEPIPFALEYTTNPVRAVRRRHRGDGLSPEVLLVNKQTHREASTVLYSQNVFRFPNLLKNIASKDTVHVAVFLEQIGAANASLLRHVVLPCPPNVVERDSSGFYRLPAGYLRNLAAIRDRCVGLKTVQLTMPMYISIVFAEWPVAASLLDLLAPPLKEVGSLESVVIDLLLFDKIRNPSVDVGNAPLLRNIRDRGWRPMITYAPSPQS
jgi:hypothetical protein